MSVRISSHSLDVLQNLARACLSIRSHFLLHTNDCPIIQIIIVKGTKQMFPGFRKDWANCKWASQTWEVMTHCLSFWFIHNPPTPRLCQRQLMYIIIYQCLTRWTDIYWSDNACGYIAYRQVLVSCWMFLDIHIIILRNNKRNIQCISLNLYSYTTG